MAHFEYLHAQYKCTQSTMLIQCYFNTLVNDFWLTKGSFLKDSNGRPLFHLNLKHLKFCWGTIIQKKLDFIKIFY